MVLRGPCGMLGIEPGLAAFKANTSPLNYRSSLPTRLSFGSSAVLCFLGRVWGSKLGEAWNTEPILVSPLSAPPNSSFCLQLYVPLAGGDSAPQGAGSSTPFLLGFVNAILEGRRTLSGGVVL